MDSYKAGLKAHLLNGSARTESVNLLSGYAAAGTTAGRMSRSTYLEIATYNLTEPAGRPPVADLLEAVQDTGEATESGYTEGLRHAVAAYRMARGMDGSAAACELAAARISAWLLGYLTAAVGLGLVSFGDLPYLYTAAVSPEWTAEEFEQELLEAMRNERNRHLDNRGS